MRYLLCGYTEDFRLHSSLADTFQQHFAHFKNNPNNWIMRELDLRGRGEIAKSGTCRVIGYLAANFAPFVTRVT
ncbi:putative oxidoreductase GLYR1 [Platysternon megacephalum]|uniref:Putative oxidoreductase GLYR1 n=1 Tax=Platysternon megacephalum TaxID=55544 RepID=A0A4D9EHF0_9SAUR|nr:putative oxidoreductase GLYR1 [Platysternon megacephalum]